MVRTVKPFAILQPPALATALAPRWGNANVTRITLDKGAALFVSHNPHALEMVVDFPWVVSLFEIDILSLSLICLPWMGAFGQVTAPLLASAHAMQISLPRIAA